jgi:hypothetical protein
MACAQKEFIARRYLMNEMTKEQFTPQSTFPNPEEDDGLEKTAQRVHDTIDKKGNELMGFAHRTADRLESAAGYLRTCDTQQMWRDVTEFCRRYPTQTMVGALIVGVLTGRALRRSF